MTKQELSAIIERRAQLMTELLFSDLRAVSASWTISRQPDFLLVMFKNSHGGLNTYLVAVIATDKPVSEIHPVPRKLFEQIAHSNVPVLLLIADVKLTKLYYGWPSPEHNQGHSRAGTVSIDVHQLDDREKKRLRKQLVEGVHAQSVAG